MSFPQLFNDEGRQMLTWLGPCEVCGENFAVDRDWWWRTRMFEGLPALHQCIGCHPIAHEGAPPVRA